MAELIQREDSLNTGREKINESIKASNRAEVKSDTAVSTANDALNKSESTQEQLDTIVIEGDSSVEAAQARVDENDVTHPTLKARIDNGMNSVNSQIAQALKGINNLQPVKTPQGFNWVDHPLINKIYTDNVGRYVLRSFDISKYAVNGLKMYVNRNVGDDGNNGLSIDKPKKTIRSAYEEGADIIIVAGGIYRRTESFFGFKVTRPLSIIALGDSPVYLTQTEPLNWQHYNDSVYFASSTNYEYIKNPSLVDNNGDWVEYQQVSSITDVESTPNSFTVADGGIYLRTHDDNEPNENNVARFTGGFNLEYEGSGKLFLKGLNIFGGTSAFYASILTDGDKLQIFAKDCDFKYSTNSDNDVVHLRGVELAIFENCSSTNGFKDGFNYYPHLGQVTNAIEINCIGARNGTLGRGSDQGSTQHGGGRIIRINGEYNNNCGSNIADEGAGTQSWIMGCIGFESRSGTNSQRANFFAYNGVDMWIEGCVGYDVGTNGSDIGGTGNIYVKNNNLLSNKPISDNSNVIEY